MEYRLLGNNCGLKVSCLSLGNWLNSNKEEDYNTFESILKRGLELGINFFDTAEVYGNGEGERQLGKALKSLKVKREDIVVSTKLFWIDSKEKKINNIGLSRKHIVENLEASLKRLQLEYVDIVFCHRFDPETPLEEICRTFDDLVRRNKTFYWGTSQWNAWEIVDAIGICEKYNLIKPVVEQPHYNMIVRDKFE
jgi:aryl-alcohol dehydrogenase-like predicted oxidoreductase